MSMGNFHDMLIDGMQKFNLEIDNEQIEQFRMYCQLLTEWNKKMNLTAITEPSDIILKHFVDSCTVLHYVRIPQNARVIDVGTGAGFPGIPLKILRKDIRLTLLDSLNKRLIFLNEVAQQLEIEVETVHGRAEDIARQEKYREQFDVVVNFAAESHVDRSIEDPEVFLRTNIIGTEVLMDASLKYGVKRYHQVSTDEVYGDLPLEATDSFFLSSPRLSI